MKTEKKTYKLRELQEMSILELTTIADTDNIDIQNSFREGLINTIINRQYQPLKLSRVFKYSPAKQTS